MRARKVLRLAAGIVLAALFLWLTLRRIDLAETRAAFLGAGIPWVIAALAVFALGYACRIRRWQIMLQADCPRLPWRSCAGPFLASFAANNVLPFRAGDLLRSFAFNQRLGTTAGVMIATLFVERLLDLLTVLIILGAALAGFGVASSRFAKVGGWVLILVGMTILFVLLFPHLFRPAALALGRGAARLAPSYGQKLLAEIEKSFRTLQHLAHGTTMVRLACWSLLVWWAEGCVFWFTALALPAISAPLAGWLALPVSTLATLIPSTPGYVGTFDYFTVQAMTELGSNPEAATAYALLVHALLWLPPTLIGGGYLLLHPVSTKQAAADQACSGLNQNNRSEQEESLSMASTSPTTRVIVVGGGFCGLAAAYELARNGIRVLVLEAENDLGGLAAAFDINGQKLDRFYHHWFTNDLEVMALIDELGLRDCVEVHPTNTGIYYNKGFFKLSSPWDLLRFTPLRLLDRVRLGLLTLRARRVRDWHALEGRTAREWLLELGGREVYRIIWQPLLQGKFGPYAEQISAVWIWNKLKLRGGSRGRRGEERLAYFRGGFVALAEALARKIRELGGRIELQAPVTGIEPQGGMWHVTTAGGEFSADRVVVTTSLPQTADMIRGWAGQDYVASLERIQYLGNICMVLELDRSLSKTYWLNVNDPSFPFVGVIEHTNFVAPERYGGHHIVYLSKYLPTTDRLYAMSADEFLDYALPFLQTMFPALERSWIKAHHLFRARWSQPVVEKHYSRLIPPEDGPVAGLHLCSMAQIYPEDRGTNYAIREGRRLGARIARLMA